MSKKLCFQAVLRVVLSLVIKVTQSCNNDVPIPYSDAKCRLSLYQLLHTLCTDPHPSDAPPVQYAVHLFSAGLKDTDIQVIRYWFIKTPSQWGNFMTYTPTSNRIHHVCIYIDVSTHQNLRSPAE